MVAAADAPNYAQRLGIQKDQVVQELGWDDDVDDDIRADIEDACGGELLDEDADEVIDVVLLWWRDDDGDLVDRLMDAITPLADDGVIWVLTPKTGKPGHVMPAEIAESAPTAGLMQTSSANLGDWSASRLVQPKSKAAGQALSAGARAPRPPTSPSRTRTGSRSASATSAARRTCCWCSFRSRSPASARASWTRFATICRSTRTTTPRRWPSRWDRHRRTRFGPPRAVSCFRCLSDFWPHGAVAQAYGVFNDDAGFANRGTFVVDRVWHHPVRRDETAGGGARSDGLWTDALTALKSG